MSQLKSPLLLYTSSGSDENADDSQFCFKAIYQYVAYMWVKEVQATQNLNVPLLFITN